MSFIMKPVALRLLSWCCLAWLKSLDNGTEGRILFHTPIVPYKDNLSTLK